MRSWLLRLYSKWPGTRGRRLIYERVGRLEARLVELQIQSHLRERALISEFKAAVDRRDFEGDVSGRLQEIAASVADSARRSGSVAQGVERAERALTILSESGSAGLDALGKAIDSLLVRADLAEHRLAELSTQLGASVEGAKTVFERAARNLGDSAGEAIRIGRENSRGLADINSRLDADIAPAAQVLVQRINELLETSRAQVESLAASSADLQARLDATAAAILARVSDTLELGTERQESGLAAAAERVRQDLDMLSAIAREQHVAVLHLLNRTLQTASLAARTRRPSGRIRVLFPVHFVEVWASLEPVWRVMRAAEDFEPIVVSHHHDFDGRGFQGEERVHAFLESRGVPHLRWGDMSEWPAENFVRYLAPDVIFRQTPWELSSPDPLRTPALGMARLCYVPYNLYVADIPDRSVNAEYLLACWRIFAINQSNADYFYDNSKIGGAAVAVTGLPKLDAIRAAVLAGDEAWPVARKEGRGFRVLWAPHHSVSGDWLRFGSFEKQHREMLAWAEQESDVEFTLRPHHLTFESVISGGAMSREELDEFTRRWDALPNTGMDETASCAGSFAASDVLITDGVSFLAEYAPTERPLVFVDREDRASLTDLGQAALNAAYRVDSIAEARSVVTRYRREGHDPQAAARRGLREFLMPNEGFSANAIVEAVRRGIAAEVYP